MNLAKSLKGLEKKRYINKISNFPRDPYLIKVNEKILPKNITYVNIYEYLVNTKSYYTKEEFKSFKSLESHKLFEGSWISGFKISTGYLVFGKVLHTQLLNRPPLKVWIQVNINGSISTAHCTCVAGLAESHIGGILCALNSLSHNSVNSVVSIIFVPT